MDKKTAYQDPAKNMEDRELLRQYMRSLEKDQLIELFIRQLRGPEMLRIPLSIFNRKLSSLESIVKYLKEDMGQPNKKIAALLRRSPQNIWITYRNSAKKHPERLFVRESRHDIPICVFEGELTMLETIVSYLKGFFTVSEIANIISRDKKTVATIIFRIKRKTGRK